jgi:NAD(P)-dependent dehydrogenase (short-subunit alcohol dehydrogenase family)
VDDKFLHKVLITGADKGLGLALTTHFLHTGWKTVAGIYQDVNNLKSLEREFGPWLVCIPLDVTDIDSVIMAYHQVCAYTQALDIMVNNAAINLPTRPVQSLAELDLTDGHLVVVFNVNSSGPLRVTQQFLPLLEQGNRKLIINISSEAGSIGSCWRTSEYAYCMSKAALNMQSRILQNALTAQGFQVLVIHPGWMRTDMGGSDAALHPDEAAEGIFELARKPRSAADSMYIDYQGNPLLW